MELYRVTIPKDDAWKVVEALGKQDVAHFIDLNKAEQPFSLPYAQRIKLCDDIEKKVHFLISKCNEYRIKMYKPKTGEVFVKKIAQLGEEKKKAPHLLFDAVESNVTDKEEFVQRMCKQITDMQADVNKMDDYREVLNFVKGMLPQLGGAVSSGQRSQDLNASLNSAPLLINQNNAGNMVEESAPMLGEIQFISGTIRGEERDRLQKLIFRATRGKALTFFQDFLQHGNPKTVYMVVFQDMANTLDRVQKICDSFMGQRFDVPDITRINNVAESTHIEIKKSRELLNTSIYQLKQYLYDINNDPTENEQERASTLEVFAWFVAKEKAIYNALNMMKARSSTYIGFLWAPLEKEQIIQQTIEEFGTTEFKSVKRNEENDHIIAPPTYFKPNELTFVF